MKPRTTDLLNQHQAKVADHTEVLFQRFREFARQVAARDLRRMSQPHGHTSSAASTGLRQTLNWIAQRPDLISFDDSSTFEAAVAAIVHRRCIDAVRAAKRREARLRDSQTSRPAPAGTPSVAAEQLQLIKPIIEETVTKILAPLDGFRHAVVTWSLFDGLTVTQIENALQRRIQEIRSTGSFQGRMPKRRTIQLWISVTFSTHPEESYHCRKCPSTNVGVAILEPAAISCHCSSNIQLMNENVLLSKAHRSLLQERQVSGQRG